MTIAPPTVIGVHHFSDSEIQRLIEKGYKGGVIREGDRIVIPAKHEAENIGNTLGYLLSMGILPSQIVVLVNGPTLVNGMPDETADRARAVNPDLQVLHQNDILKRTIINRTSVLDHLEREYRTSPERLRGKGMAFFAAMLALHEAGTDDEARIFFLDADIRNPSQADPIGRLLIGADQFPPIVRMVKLALLGRDNAGIQAHLNSLENLFSAIAALRWPLCGQVMVRWGDLKHMRLASGYAVEMAMMMDLIARHGTPEIFGEVELGAPVSDKHNDDRTHVLMYTEIMEFIDAVLRRDARGLHYLTRDQMREMNVRDPMRIWTPARQAGEGSNTLKTRLPDLILPSIAELFG